MLLTNRAAVQRLAIDSLRLSATPVMHYPQKAIRKLQKLIAAHKLVAARACSTER